MTAQIEILENIAATIAALARSLSAETRGAVTKNPSIAGLDSIQLVELVLKLEDLYAIRLNAEDIDAVTSLESLAGIVSQRRASPAAAMASLPARAAASTLDRVTISIARAEMHGPATRLSGTILAEAGTAISLISSAGGRILQVSEQQIAAGHFEAVCNFDLARENLAECRLAVTLPGGLAAEYPLPRAAATVFPCLQDGAANRRHLIAALPDNITCPTPTELLHNFESLGDNCEFGVFAAMLGDHRASLFRAGGTSEWMIVPRPGQITLAEAIGDSLARFAEPEDLRLEYIFGEWMVFSNRYDFCFHSGEKDRATPLPPIAAAQSQKLLAQKANLLADLANPAKIFIRKSNGRETETDIARLLAAMRRHGQAWLLWLTPASEAEPPGTVALYPNRFLRVTTATLAEYTRANRISALSWLTALTAAHLTLATPAAR